MNHFLELCMFQKLINSINFYSHKEIILGKLAWHYAVNSLYLNAMNLLKIISYLIRFLKTQMEPKIGKSQRRIQQPPFCTKLVKINFHYPVFVCVFFPQFYLEISFRGFNRLLLIIDIWYSVLLSVYLVQPVRL